MPINKDQKLLPLTIKYVRASGAMATRLTSTSVGNNSPLHQKIAGSIPAGLISWLRLHFALEIVEI
ncbi:hypothetical protein BOTCAL_0519g00010 [Botryotinia calthae]|uniref:Uncharacterized protein n=1 Tax=Botryotinia calthae TaxID=38488 RepID=A0A4Y8CLL4_9HELO|nr:hypothetical protein BOTCAL_0519g00010 [Botryotinia calthae]